MFVPKWVVALAVLLIAGFGLLQSQEPRKKAEEKKPARLEELRNAKVKLAKELGTSENSVRRLLDLHHRSQMWAIDEALGKMNAELHDRSSLFSSWPAFAGHDGVRPCSDFEVRIILRHVRLRTSESKEH